MPQSVGAIGKLVDGEGVGNPSKQESRSVPGDGQIVHHGLVCGNELALKVLGAIVLVDADLAGVASEKERFLCDCDTEDCEASLDFLNPGVGRTIELENSHVTIAASCSEQTPIFGL